MRLFHVIVKLPPKRIPIFVFSILSVLMQISCNKDINKSIKLFSDTVQIIPFNGEYLVEPIITNILVKKDFPDRTEFLYSDLINSKNNNGNREITIFKSNNSFILYNNDTCKFVDKKYYKLNGKEIEIKKYYYDVEFIVDEESVLYINDSFGLVRKTSLSWMFSRIFNSNKITKEINRLLINDTTLFILTQRNKSIYYENLQSKIFKYKN